MDIHVRPLQRTLRVDAGVNLLEALRAHDIPVSYSCLAGRCGTCRCKVTSGHVLESGREQRPPQALEDATSVLACQTFLTEPCTVEIPEPDEVVVHPARIIKATVVAIESPRIAVARPVPLMKEVASSPAASRIAFIMDSAPRSMSPFMTKAATGWTWPLITALVTPCSMRDSAAGMIAQHRARSAADSDIEAGHERGDFTGHRAAIASAARSA